MPYKNIKIYCLAAIASVMIISFGCALVPTRMGKIAENSITKIEFSHGWFSHWGDFDPETPGRLISIANKAEWNPYTLNETSGRNEHTFFWLKHSLSETSLANAALFLPHFSSYQAFEVYLENTLIYKTSDLGPSFTNKHCPILWHLILLPADYAGKTLLFRFYSDHPRFIGFLSYIWFGERNALVDHFVITDIDQTLLSLLFIIISILGYLFLIKVYHRKNPQLFSFASMSLCSGIYFLVAESKITLLFFNQPIMLSYLRFIMFFLFIACRSFTRNINIVIF